MTTIIGVDPGTRTGLAVLVDQTLVRCQTFNHEDLHFALSLCIQEYAPDLIAVETPGPGIFVRPGANVYAMRRIARNVGQCQARADEVYRLACFLLHKDHVITKRPVRGGTKRAWTPQMWRAAFGWTGRMPSNHARDAALLARRVAQEARV